MAISAHFIYDFEHRLRVSPPSPYKNRRVLDPICQLLRSEQFKQALKACDKAIGKAAKDNAALLRCLKGYTLIALNKTDDARVTLLNAARDEGKNGLGDLDVLIFLSTLLPEVRELKTLLEAADKSAKLYPNNLPLIHEIVFIFIRHNEMKRVQLVCMKAHKSHHDPRFLYWTLTAMLMQVIQNKAGDPANALLLSLSARYISENPPVTNGEWNGAEFWLKVKHAELALREASHPSQSEQDRKSLVDLKASFLALFKAPEAQPWLERELGFELWRRDSIKMYGTDDEKKALAKELMQSLDAGDTNWHTIITLIHLAVSTDFLVEKEAKTNTEANGNAHDSLPSELARSLQKQLQTLSEDSKRGRERGFLLGQLKLHLDLSHGAYDDHSLRLMATYFTRFGNKACCFDDLLPYLNKLEYGQRLTLLNQLQAPDNFTSSIDVLTRHINYEKISQHARYANVELDSAELVSDALKYTRQYFEALPMGKDLLQTDLQPADDLALCAVEALLRSFSRTGNVERAVEVVALLRFASNGSNYKFEFKFLLIRLYRLLGLPREALEIWHKLGTKQIQRDTLHHFLLERASTFALCSPIYQNGVSADMDFLNNYLTGTASISVADWYVTGIHESAEATVKTWRTCILFKIEEYTTLHRYLKTSFARHLLGGEIMRIARLHGVVYGIEPDLAPVSGKYIDSADTRDNSVLSASFLELTQMGPSIGSEYGEAAQATQLLSQGIKPSQGLSESACLEDQMPAQLTAAERGLFSLAQSLVKFDSKPSDNETLDIILDSFARLVEECASNISRLIEVSHFGWQIHHWASTMAEALVYINDFAVPRSSQNRSIQQKNAKAVKEALNKALPAYKTVVDSIMKRVEEEISLQFKEIPSEYQPLDLQPIADGVTAEWSHNLLNTALRFESLIKKCEKRS